MRTRFAVLALAVACTAPVASAQNSEPLPGQLVGSFSVTRGANNRRAVVPVELTNIKLDGAKVTGIVSNYRSPNGYCVADKTPFNGTFQDGQLSIKSMPLMSQRPDGGPCGGITINVKVSAGRATGTYSAGALAGPIEFEAK
jgi:hypothetical protein